MTYYDEISVFKTLKESMVLQKYPKRVRQCDKTGYEDAGAKNDFFINYIR